MTAVRWSVAAVLIVIGGWILGVVGRMDADPVAGPLGLVGLVLLVGGLVLAWRTWRRHRPPTA